MLHPSDPVATAPPPPAPAAAAPAARAGAAPWALRLDALQVRLLARPDLLALAGIAAFALALRLVWLETVPPNVTADEADNLAGVYHVVSGTGPGLFGLDWKPAPAFSIHVIAAVMTVAGYSITGMRLASVLFSVAALAPFYLLARRVTGSVAALVATLLLSANAWYLNFSRAGWENVWVASFLLGGMLALEAGLRSGRLRFFVLAGVCCALGWYGYYSGRAILPILLLYLPLALWRRRVPARAVLGGYALMVAVAVVLFAPQARTLAANWSFASRRTEAVWVLSGVTSLSEAASVLLGQALVTLRAFVLFDPTLLYNPRYNEQGSGMLDPITGLVYLAGLAVGARRWRETGLWWSALVFGLFAIQVLSRGSPDGARAVPFAPVMYLFVALALAEILRRPSLLPLRWALVVTVPVVVQMTVSDYFAWMSTPELAKARQPAIDPADFTTWQSLQLADAQAGKPGFNVQQWQERRPTTVKRLVATPLPGAAVVAETVPVAQGASAPLVGRLTARVGAGGAGQQLDDPHGVAVDGAGNAYVADTGTGRVLKFDRGGKLLAQLGGPGDMDGQFQEPFDLAVDGNGQVYVLDSERGVIERFNAAGHYEATILGDADTYHPRGIALDTRGHLYVADTGRNRVLEVSSDGEILHHWEKVGGIDLDQPTDVVVDRSGDLYVVEPDAQRLQKFDQEGNLLARRALARSNTREAPHLALTARGQLVMTDPGSNRVVLLTDALLLDSRLGGEGMDIRTPVGVAVGRSGEVWVVDVASAQALRLVRGG